MSEKPILFSGPMVNAILAGKKTQTRRIVKPQPKLIHAVHADASLTTERIFRSGDQRIHCPYGTVGGTLWVKESIRRGYCGDMSMSSYVADGMPTVADAWPWKLQTLPSMFCARGLSRITLEITEVRVQRLQEISEEDAYAEGIKQQRDVRHNSLVWDSAYAVSQFRKLWDSINVKKCPWSSNCWVWAVSFKLAGTE